jgi:hypothetical protein
MVDVGPDHDPARKGSVRVRDIGEWSELVRRLHFPFYEQARLYIDVAKRDGFIEGENEISAMLPRTLKSLVDEYADGDWEDEQAAIELAHPVERVEQDDDGDKAKPKRPARARRRRGENPGGS